MRCGVLGGPDCVTMLQGGSGLSVESLGDDLRSFEPHRYEGKLDVLVVQTAVMQAAGARPAAVVQSLQRLLPDCIHLCLCAAHERESVNWPERDVFVWPDEAFRLFQRLQALMAETPANWWDDASQRAVRPTSPPVVAPAPAAPATAASVDLPPVRVIDEPLTRAVEPLPRADRLPPVGGAPPAQSGTGQLISVIGAKGGVGQTWVAVNLAIALANCVGMECLLADLDLASADVAVQLDLLGSPTIVDLVQHGEGDGWPWTYLQQLRHCAVRVLTGPERPQTASLLSPDAVTAALATLQAQFAYTVCDHAPGDTDALFQTLSEQAAAIVLVTTLEAPALRQAKLRLDHLRQRNLQARTHVVFNGAGPGTIPPPDGAAYLEHTAFTVIPADRKRVDQSIHEARPLALEPRHDVARAIAALAATLSGQQTEPVSLETRWRKWVEQLWKR